MYATLHGLTFLAIAFNQARRAVKSATNNSPDSVDVPNSLGEKLYDGAEDGPSAGTISKMDDYKHTEREEEEAMDSIATEVSSCSSDDESGVLSEPFIDSDRYIASLAIAIPKQLPSNSNKTPHSFKPLARTSLYKKVWYCIRTILEMSKDNRSQIVRYLLVMAKKVILNVARSSFFLALYCSIAWYATCIAHRVFLLTNTDYMR